MKTSKSFQGVTPVILSSPFTVSASNSAIPDSGLLAYPFRKAIIIEEIRWDLNNVSSGAYNLGALVSTKLSLGQHYLMRDPVPVWLLGTSMAASQEQAADTLLATPASFSHYRWRLPEPLYVEAGQVLSSWFSRGADGLGSINGQVTYVGRTVSPDQPRPGIIPVPYAASFVTISGDVYRQSNEFNLFNPFDKDLRVQRLTGRVLRVDNFNSVIAVTPAPNNTTSGPNIAVQIFDSWGGKMVNNLTGPSDVFDILRSAWTVDTVMPPKGIYDIRAWNLNSNFGITFPLVLHAALIGVREEGL